MPLRFAALASTFLALGAGPAAAQAADVVRPSSVTRTVTLPAGGAVTLALACPARAVALNASISRLGPGVEVRDSIPGVDAGDWRFRLANPSGGRRRAAATIRCVRLALPRGVSGARLVVDSRHEMGVAIPARGTTTREIRCNPGSLATGYALRPGSDAKLVQVASALPSAGGWFFELENRGARQVRTDVSVRCLKRVVPARRRGSRTSLRFEVSRPLFDDVVGPGRRSFSNACSRRQFAVANGVSLDPGDDIALLSSYPAGQWTGVWRFRQAAGTETVESSLVCLGLRAQFR